MERFCSAPLPMELNQHLTHSQYIYTYYTQIFVCTTIKAKKEEKNSLIA